MFVRSKYLLLTMHIRDKRHYLALFERQCELCNADAITSTRTIIAANK